MNWHLPVILLTKAKPQAACSATSLLKLLSSSPASSVVSPYATENTSFDRTTGG